MNIAHRLLTVHMLVMGTRLKHDSFSDLSSQMIISGGSMTVHTMVLPMVVSMPLYSSRCSAVRPVVSTAIARSASATFSVTAGPERKTFIKMLLTTVVRASQNAMSFRQSSLYNTHVCNEGISKKKCTHHVPFESRKWQMIAITMSICR